MPQRFPRTVRSRVIRSAVLGATLLSLCGCGNARAEAAIAQELNDAANEISGLKNDVADLNTALDSLRLVVARQDTLINRIAAVNNIPR